MCWYKYFAGQEAIWLIQALSFSFGLPMVSIFIHYFFPLFCLYPKCLNWKEHLRTGTVSNFKRGYSSKTPMTYKVYRKSRAGEMAWWAEFEPQIHILNGENKIPQVVFRLPHILCGMNLPHKRVYLKIIFCSFSDICHLWD